MIDLDTYGRALGAYQREVVAVSSPYDRWLAGDEDAMSELQKEGLAVFFTNGKCNTCHFGPMLSDFQFIVNGVPQIGSGKDVIPGDDTGREKHTGDPDDRYAFRTPTLRNVELTAPYMHDGVFETLEEVVEFYDAGARPRHEKVTDLILPPVLRARESESGAGRPRRLHEGAHGSGKGDARTAAHGSRVRAVGTAAGLRRASPGMTSGERTP